MVSTMHFKHRCNGGRFTIAQMPTTQLWINLVPISPSCTRLIINNGLRITVLAFDFSLVQLWKQPRQQAMFLPAGGSNVPLPAMLKVMRQWPLFKNLFRQALMHLSSFSPWSAGKPLASMRSLESQSAVCHAGCCHTWS